MNSADSEKSKLGKAVYTPCNASVRVVQVINDEYIFVVSNEINKTIWDISIVNINNVKFIQ